LAKHHYGRNTERNGTYTAGLDLPFINLSAQSGWTSSMSLDFWFDRAGSTCGSNGLPFAKAPRVSTRA
jgi:hypothetical protein